MPYSGDWSATLTVTNAGGSNTARRFQNAGRVEGLPQVRVAITAADLDAAGWPLRAAVWANESVRSWPIVDRGSVFVTAASDEILTPSAALALVVSHLAHHAEREDMSEQTVRKASFHMVKLVSFIEAAWPTPDIRVIGRDQVLRWLAAPTLGAEQRSPAPRTREVRRWAADLFFKTLRALDLFDGDPLLDVPHETRPTVAFRSLTSPEVARCRRYSARTTRDTYGPALFALALASGTTAEISHICAADVDLDRRAVWLPGSTRTDARWGVLDDFGVDALTRRVADQAATPDLPLVYRGKGSPESRQATVCTAIASIFRRAGFSPDHLVRPRSVRGWLARQVFDATGDIEEVAHTLGMRRLDDAKKILGLEIGRRDIPPPHRCRA